AGWPGSMPRPRAGWPSTPASWWSSRTAFGRTRFACRAATRRPTPSASPEEGTPMMWTWLSLAGLGAVHGLNPGMGWLFAVALGMEEGRPRAVWRALPPLALGHALAIAAAVLGAAAVGELVPSRVLVWIVGGMLLGLGALRLVRHRHPRYGGMQ